MTRSLEFIEIDLPYCDLTWRTSPCAAEGEYPCYNTRATCQDVPHYTPVTQTLRLIKSTEGLPLELDAYPSLIGVSFTPQMISLGKNLGTRASLSISVADSTDPDYTFDKYALSNVETGLTLSESMTSGDHAAYSGAIRQNEVVFACELQFPEEPQLRDAVIFRAGSGTWLGLKSGKLHLRVDTLIIEVDAPTFGTTHTLSWDVLINPGRIRLWLDGVLVGIASQTTTIVSWSNNAIMGYLSSSLAPEASESNNFWEPLTGASLLRVYHGGQLSRKRDYDPLSQGTLWGRFRTRQKYLTGVPVRWIIGDETLPLDQMEIRHFILESLSGPSEEGVLSFVAKDALKLADGDKAVAPRPTTGVLSANLTDSATSATLYPAGVGNAEYPASGWLNLGGREIVSYTRVGNTLTMIRGRLGTPRVAHELGDSVQFVLSFIDNKASDIARHLLEVYCGVPSQYIPLTAWHQEDDSYLARTFTRHIAEPTPVKTLLAELIQQASLSIFWDDLEPSIQFQVLKEVETGAALFSTENILEGSFSYREQPDQRLSSLLVKYGQSNPLGRSNDDESYRQQALAINDEAIEAYGTDAFMVIRAAWIPQLASNTAFTLAAKQLGRFEDAPRRFKFGYFRGGQVVPELGGGYRISMPSLQAASGVLSEIPIQLVWIRPSFDSWELEAEEVQFRAIDLGDIGNPDPPPPPDSPPERTIVISASSANINLRSIYDQYYRDFGGATPLDKLPVHFIINSGVWIGSVWAGAHALNVGSWPTTLVNLKLTLRGQIRGMGGRGGNGGSGESPRYGSTPGEGGGPALYCRVPLSLVLDGGLIAGGGGGGGGAGVRNGWTFNTRGGGGGGGAGYNPGAGGEGPAEAEEGATGGPDAGGNGGASWTKDNWWESEYMQYGIRGGIGGSLGSPGQTGATQGGGSADPGSPGGAAGIAIDGNSYIAQTGSGSVLGPRIN